MPSRFVISCWLSSGNYFGLTCIVEISPSYLIVFGCNFLEPLRPDVFHGKAMVSAEYAVIGDRHVS